MPPVIDKNDQPYYILMDFLTKLHDKMGRTYGWRTAYIAASTADGCHPVTIDDIRDWQSIGRIPAWAYDQIDRMKFPEHDDITFPKREIH